ncbi:MAG: SDR family oxidoreductase [Burkholderiales bacterium]|nr:SDR family oxidoreductase [Burkholderiales bacterium]
MHSAHPLQGKQVVVVGGSAGIGLAVARAARDGGADVSIISRSARSHDGLSGIAADVTDTSSLQLAFAQLPQRIDALVLTSGASIASARLNAMNMADLHQAFDVKVFGYVATLYAALPYLDETASITLTSGLLARKFNAGGLVKSMVNASVEAMAKVLAKELAPRRVNVVSPGITDTDAWGSATAEGRQAMLQKMGDHLPVRRVGQPAELAQAYLLAISNGFMTGAVLDVDGGGLLV